MAMTDTTSTTRGRSRFSIGLGGVFVALAASLLLAARPFLTAQPENTGAEKAPLIQGPPGTVLFLTHAESGQINIELATAQSLMESWPEDITIHFASFPEARAKVERVSALRPPTARPIVFHEIQGPDRYEAILRGLGCDKGKGTSRNTSTNEEEKEKDEDKRSGMVDACLSHAPGVRGAAVLSRQMDVCAVGTWTGPEHHAIIERVREIVRDVDPAVAVSDILLRPAVHALESLNRLHVLMSPNALSDYVGPMQPYGAGFWKYPALGTGFSFPVPWYRIPENIYVNFRIITGIVAGRAGKATNAYLRSKGVNPLGPLDFNDDIPKISQTLPEASLPVTWIPRNMTAVGAMILDSAPAAKQDPALAAWLARAPTVVINLGTLFKYTEARARTMAAVVERVLERSQENGEGIQILWKMAPHSDFGEDYALPLSRYVQEERLKIVDWIPIDTLPLLEAQQVVASVHHGGSSSYNEATVAGVPQVIMPMWEDLYNFAQLAEDLGIGIFTGRRTAPAWDVEEVVGAVLRVTDGGETSLRMRGTASRIGETVRARPGRAAAARIIADLALPGGRGE